MSEDRVPEYLYVMSHSEHGPCKIGRAKDPEKRLKVLQIGHPHALKVWASRDPYPAATCNAEYEAHQALADCRLCGEWFRCSVAEAVRVIDKLTVAGFRSGVGLQVCYDDRPAPDWPTTAEFRYEPDQDIPDIERRVAVLHQAIGGSVAPWDIQRVLEAAELLSHEDSEYTVFTDE